MGIFLKNLCLGRGGIADRRHGSPSRATCGSGSDLLEAGPGPFFWALPGAAHERGHVLGPVQRRDRDHCPSRRRECPSPVGR